MRDRQAPATQRGPAKVSNTENDQGHSTQEDRQTSFFDVPRSRNSWRDGRLVVDPTTSRAAAESVSLQTVTRLQKAILNAFRLHRKPMSDEEIIESLSWMRCSESGVRSRRSELLRAGLIEIVDELGVTKHGRRSRRYQVRAQRGAA
jgi:hypothetical protein